jgi:hypothetical protein
MLRHIKRNAIAYTALFLALGGTSYAAVRLPAGSVGTKELHSGAVTKTKLQRGAVTSTAVQDHTLKAVDFARGQLTGGPKGDKGDAGQKGDKGDPGPTFGIAGVDTGAGKANTLPAAGTTVTATKSVALTTRSRLYVFGSVLGRVDGCGSPLCVSAWGLLVDGVPVESSSRRVRAPNGQSAEGTVTPFGVTEPLEPGTHTLALTRGLAGTAAFTYTDQALGAIALGV